MDQTLRGEAVRTHSRLVELETTARRARLMVERVLDELAAAAQAEVFPGGDGADNRAEAVSSE